MNKQNYPKVSVIVPVYNGQKYLSTCIEALLGQKKSLYEILVVDDGSTDESGAIADRYAGEHPSIKVIHQENRGVCAARNRGIREAAGDYIGFCDQDDAVSPDYYSVLSGLLTGGGADIAVGNFRQMDMVLTESEAALPADFQEHTCSGKEALGRLVRGEGMFRSYVWNKLYRKELFRDISYPEDRSLEDQFVTYRLFAASRKVAYTEWAGYYYRPNPESLTNRNWHRIGMDYVEAWNQIREFCREHYPEYLEDAKAQLVSAAVYTLRRMGKYGSREDREKLMGYIALYSDRYGRSRLSAVTGKRKLLVFLYRIFYRGRNR